MRLTTVWMLVVAGGLLMGGCGGISYPELAEPGYLKRGSPKAVADDLFTKAIAIQPGDSGPYLLAGHAYVRAGYHAEGVGYLERVLAMDPTNGYRIADIAALFIEVGDEKRARRFWDVAKGVGGAKARTWSPVAAAWAKAGNFERAEVMWEKVLELPAGWALSPARKHWVMGIGWLEGGQRERADPLLDAALRVGEPGDGLLRITIGAAYLKAGFRERGEELLKKGYVLERAARIGEANREIGAAYAAVGEFKTAAAFFKRAVAANPNDDDTYIIAGTAYIEGGNAEKGEKYLSTALSLATGDWEAIALIGEAWLTLERASGAPAPTPARAPTPAPTPAPAPDDY